MEVASLILIVMMVENIVGENRLIEKQLSKVLYLNFSVTFSYQPYGLNESAG
ncbi:unnamed protein product [Arabis nemorensis]|uniref:Uncharacterized protein n=1 Tax=Arabis nemorensis TaxID=586526 RepID=A0A565ARM3_9BRAS|nr:unnamed protein product [Arabis nemorensis]